MSVTKKFNSLDALDHLENLVKELSKKKTLASHHKQINVITEYLDSIYNQGLKDGFKAAEKSNNIKL